MPTPEGVRYLSEVQQDKGPDMFALSVNGQVLVRVTRFINSNYEGHVTWIPYSGDSVCFTPAQSTNEYSEYLAENGDDPRVVATNLNRKER
jgi:hypothetical protein